VGASWLALARNLLQKLYVQTAPALSHESRRGKLNFGFHKFMVWKRIAGLLTQQQLCQLTAQSDKNFTKFFD
jgi:hypothetical protein